MGWKALKVEKKTWICSCIVISDLGPSDRSIMAAGASQVVEVTAMPSIQEAGSTSSKPDSRPATAFFLIDTGWIAAARNCFIMMY